MRIVSLLAAMAVVQAMAQPVVSPANAAREQSSEATVVPDERAPNETVVIGPRWRESEPTGEYHQPGWTDRRRFPQTRVYVAPAGTATFEFWVEPKITSDGGDARVRTLYEMSFGLGHRLQLDLYLRLEHNGTEAVAIESERVELRWALADWGVLPGNPTLYLEWIRPTAAPQRGEVKLLLGGELTHRLYWGANLFWERELWGHDQESEYGVTGGLSYSLLDSKFSLGAEAKLEIVDRRDNRFMPNEVEFLVGPSLIFRPTPSAHLLLVAFMGPGFERDEVALPFASTFVFQPNLVLGWRF